MRRNETAWTKHMKVILIINEDMDSRLPKFIRRLYLFYR
jgi:hypothetical protein